jgi:hypothetical protein
VDFEWMLFWIVMNGIERLLLDAFWVFGPLIIHEMHEVEQFFVMTRGNKR